MYRQADTVLADRQTDSPPRLQRAGCVATLIVGLTARSGQDSQVGRQPGRRRSFKRIERERFAAGAQLPFFFLSRSLLPVINAALSSRIKSGVFRQGEHGQDGFLGTVAPAGRPEGLG